MNTSPVVDLLRGRRSTRSIDSRPLPEEVVQDLIEAVRLTPSCANNQPWRYIFAESENERQRISEAFIGANAAWAPRGALIVCGYSRASEDCRNEDGREYHQFDLGMATMNMMLAATSHGLVARPMGGFNPDVIRRLYGLDPEDQPLVMVSIGRPGANEDHLPEKYKGIEDKPRNRKSAAEIIRRV
ncbi:MAG: nitroreductase family protein [bacterium]